MQKSYKDDYIYVKLYRPIALFDKIRKVLELILTKKISTLAKIYHLLPKKYFGKIKKCFNRICRIIFGEKNLRNMDSRKRSFYTNVGCNKCI